MDKRTNYLALILLDALEDENESDINYILKHAKYVDAAYVLQERGIAPLHYVCGMENERIAIEVAKKFLEMGANANVQSDDNMTPLHVAAMYGRVEIVKLLLDHGADLELQDDDHKTPLLYAIDECHFEVVQVMRDHIYKKKCLKKKQSNLPPSREYQNKNNKSEKLLKFSEPELKTPNRIEYNFDTTSPYYINITHRRHKLQPKFPQTIQNEQAFHDKAKSTAAISTSKDINDMESVNIFTLTEENLEQLSRRASKMERSQTSLIKMWQDKVEKSRARQSIIKQFDNINDMIDEIIDNDQYNYNNVTLNQDDAYMTSESHHKNYHSPFKHMKRDNDKEMENIIVVEEEKAEKEEEYQTPLKIQPRTPLNKIVEEITKAKLIDIETESKIEMNMESSYQTVPEIVTDESGANVKKLNALENNQYILQMTEAYVHTDDENGLIFYETKLLANPATGQQQQKQQQKQKQSTGSIEKKLEKATSEKSPADGNLNGNLNKSEITVQSKGNLTVPTDYDTDTLRKELTMFGEPPGPITKTTKRLYIKKLIKYKRQLITTKALKEALPCTVMRFSVELQRTIKSKEQFDAIKNYGKYETESMKYFANSNLKKLNEGKNSNNNSNKNKNENNKKSIREGHLKQSFIYMLIDPRISCNLPGESLFLEQFDTWKRFLQSIFYVGKGKTSRPYSHLYDAMKSHAHLNYKELHKKPATAVVAAEAAAVGKGTSKTTNKVKNKQSMSTNVDVNNTNNIKHSMKPPTNQERHNNNKSNNRKLQRILEIWDNGHGVVCLHVFHNIIPIEAYTREAAIIEALGLQHLTNCKRGNYYGPAKTWTMKEKKFLGIALLYKAMLIYLAEGESQLSPCDLI